MKHLLCLLVLLPLYELWAQKEKQDFLSFAAPSGWTRSTPDQSITYTDLRNERVQYAFVQVYPSFASSGQHQGNYEHFWKQIITPTYQQAPVKPEITTQKGWTVLTGSTKIRYSGTEYTIILQVFNSADKTLPIFILYDKNSYQADIKRFWESIEVPEIQSAPNQQNTASQANTNASMGGVQKIRRAVTNFDDGWVATAKMDHVLLIKNDVEVRIYPPDSEVDKKIPQGMYSLDYAWSITVPPYFRVEALQVRNKAQFSSGENMWEAAVVDKETGKSRYAGLTLYWNNGRFHTILVLTPDRNSYYQLFPDFDSFTKMLEYNKFGVEAADLPGTWADGGSSSTDYYNIATSTYAGTSVAATSARFTFLSNGTYNLEEQYYLNGRSGKQKYTGKYTSNLWQMVMTAKQKGEDDGQFWCQFEAVRGGVVLHLMHKKYSGGQKYSLVKIK
jgi:hypothetical protein